MSTIRKIAPAFVVLTVLVGAALAIGIMSRQQQGQQDGPLVDNGPNAGLSNDELVSVAITNMHALKSYHFVLTSDLPSIGALANSNMTITADVQLHGKGSRYEVRGEGGAISAGPGLLIETDSLGAIATTAGVWYESYDGGKTWVQPQGDTPLGFLLAGLECAWGSRWAGEETAYSPTTCESLLKAILGGATFNDGTPRLERIDGVITRHMTFVPPTRADGANYSMAYQAIDVWVSTSTTPTIRRLRLAAALTVPMYNLGSTKAAAFSPDSKTLAVAHGHRSDWTVRLWDMTKPGSEPMHLVSSAGPFSSVAFSPDGKILAAALTNHEEACKQIVLWNTGNYSAEPIVLKARSLPDYSGEYLDYWYTSLAFRPDGKMLAATAPDGLYLWEAPYGEAMPTVVGQPGESVAFSPDGNTVAVGNRSGSIYLYDVRHLKNPSRTLSGAAELRAIAFSPDGRFLASHSNNEITLWDLQRPEPAPVTLPGDPDFAETLAFSHNSKLLAASGESGIVRLWDLSQPMPTGSPPTLSLEGGGYGVYAVTFSPDGKLLAATNFMGEARLWNIQDLQNITAPATPAPAPTPTILKDQVQTTSRSYTQTWTWSRFNESFGEIKPPPSDTIK